MISDMIRQQFFGYWICIVAGVGTGALGGLLNMVAGLLRKRQIVLWVCDVVLWLILSVTMIAISYICCEGTLRLYIFFGFFSGFLFSYCTINWVFSKIVNHILYKKNKDLKNVKM